MKNLLLALISVAPLSAGIAFSTTTAKKPKATYKQVQALLDAECIACHNNKNHAGAVDLHNYGAIMASKVVVAKKPGESRLVTFTDGTKKPLMPMGKKALTAAQVKLLKDWIAQGAKAK